MSSKAETIAQIIAREAGYVNRSEDSGGPTKYGITERTARSFGYGGDIKNLPERIAMEIYVEHYWNAVSGDQMEMYSQAITAEVVDTAVNVGPLRSVKFLQRSLNVLNGRGELYADVKADGIVGPKTQVALAACLRRRDEATLLKALNCLQGAYYIKLAERREKDETFVYGWLRERITI